MTYCTQKNCFVRGVAASVPPTIRKTDAFTRLVGEDDVRKFIKNVGVLQSHVADEHMTTSDLCFTAANSIIERLGIERDSIDVLLFVSQTPDYIAPSTACILQYRLGLSENCIAYDINLACSGYIYGVTAAMSYLQTDGINRVLLLCGDTVSKHCSPEDRGLVMLSADAGTATIIDAGLDSFEELNSSLFKLKTIGKDYKSLIVPYGGYRHRHGDFNRTLREPGISRNDYDGYMNGANVFRFSITEVPKLFREFFGHFDICPDEIDNFFLHQANLFILKHIAKRVKIPLGKMPVSIDRYGNTGAATVPLTMCDHYASDAEAIVNENILICGFGIGLSLGIGLLRLKDCVVMPIIVCHEHFEDNIDNLHNETTSFLNK